MMSDQEQQIGLGARIKRFFGSKWHYLVVFIFGAILSVGVWSYAMQIMTGDDYAFHVTRLQSASRAWSNGQIVPQVDPDALDGFGYAYNIFYGPLLTYLAAGLQAILGVWPYAINLVLLFCMIGAGMTMCYAMTKISKNQVLAMLVAVFYMAAPYALNNLYSRMALGEVAAFVAAPILLLGLWYLLTKQKHAARCIAVSAAMLVLSHSLSAMLFALMAAVFVLLNFRKIFNFNNVWRMILGVVVALGLSAFFTLPLVEAKFKGDYGIFDSGYADVYFGSNPRSMNDHRIWPQQLVVMNYAGGTNAEGLGGEFGVTLGIVFIIGLIGFWFIRKQIENEDERRFTTSLYIIAVLAILLSLPVVNWYYMPGIMWQMQFPWRALMVSTVSLAVVSGYVFYAVIKGLSQEKQRVIAVTMAMAAVYLVMPLIMPRADRHIEEGDVKIDPVALGWEAEYAPMQMLCSPDVEEDVAQGYACSLGRIREKIAERGTNVEVIDGTAEIHDVERDGLNFEFVVSDTVGETIVELPVIYYPGYEAKLDDESLVVNYSSANGLVAVIIPDGESGEVVVRYGLSLATKVGAVISLSTAGLGVLWVIIIGIVDRQKRKKEARAIAEEARLMDSVFSVVEDELPDLSKKVTMEDLMPPELDMPPKEVVPEMPMPEKVQLEPKPVRKRTTRAKKATTKKSVAKAEEVVDAADSGEKAVKAANTATAKRSTKTRVVRLPEADADEKKTSAKAATKTTKTRVKRVKAEEE